MKSPKRALAGTLGLLATTAVLVAAQEEIPSVDDLRGRALGTIAVLGDYIYFEGGEISQFIDNKEDPYQSRPSNVTWSLSIKDSWTNETVNFKEISRGDKPIVKDPSIWADTKQNKLYQWDGQGPWGDQEGAKDPRPWCLEASGDGDGEWMMGKVQSPDVYSKIVRNIRSATTVCGRKGYAVGGYANLYSDEDVDSNDGVPTPGMLTFDLDSNKWTNQSIASVAPPYGSLFRAKAECVTGFGDIPYVMTIGGKSSAPDQVELGDGISMRNITFYDTENDKWLWQITSGGEPKARWDHCMAGVEGPDGTYEIYVYGGQNNADAFLDDVWVLTLPGFHWTKIDTPTPKRREHDCLVIGSKKRQMLSSGGAQAAKWAYVDDWKYALGVMDLNTLQWVDRYDGNEGDEYKSPEIVRKWYKNGGMKNVEWSSDEVKAIFEKEADRDSSGTSPGGSKESDTSKKDDSSTPVGAIAGGVVGGVALLLGAGLLVFFLRRRKRRNAKTASASPTSGSNSAYQHVSPHPTPSPGPGGYYAYKQEPHQQHYKPELSSEPIYRYELPSETRDMNAVSEMDASQTLVRR